MTRFVVVFFAFLGVVFMALLIALIVEEISTKVRGMLRKRRKEYEYKHRFDKSPTAECYCIDCWYRDNENSKCGRHDELYVEDDWFCKDAMPD